MALRSLEWQGWIVEDSTCAWLVLFWDVPPHKNVPFLAPSQSPGVLAFPVVLFTDNAVAGKQHSMVALGSATAAIKDSSPVELELQSGGVHDDCDWLLDQCTLESFRAKWFYISALADLEHSGCGVVVACLLLPHIRILLKGGNAVVFDIPECISCMSSGASLISIRNWTVNKLLGRKIIKYSVGQSCQSLERSCCSKCPGSCAHPLIFNRGNCPGRPVLFIGQLIKNLHSTFTLLGDDGRHSGIHSSELLVVEVSKLIETGLECLQSLSISLIVLLDELMVTDELVQPEYPFLNQTRITCSDAYFLANIVAHELNWACNSILYSLIKLCESRGALRLKRMASKVTAMMIFFGSIISTPILCL